MILLIDGIVFLLALPASFTYSILKILIIVGTVPYSMEVPMCFFYYTSIQTPAYESMNIICITGRAVFSKYFTGVSAAIVGRSDVHRVALRLL